MQRCGIEQLGRQRAVETVAMEVEAAEEDKGPELRGDVAAEVLPGDGDADDAGVGVTGYVGAGNAGPLTRRGVVFFPGGKEGDGGGGGVDGGFEGEEGEAVRGEGE